MALRWDEGDQVPDSIRDKTPEQIASELATAQAQTQVQQSEMEQMRTRLAEAEGRNRQTQVQNQPPEVPSVLVDEEGAFAHRTAPLAAGLMHTQAQVAVMRAEQTILADPFEARIYRLYRSEVEEMFKRVPLAHQPFPESYINCFNIVKGNHFKELKEMMEKRTGIFTEPAGDNPPPPPPAADDKLTPEELAMCTKYKIDPEEFKKKSRNAVRMMG